ncbi:conserved protein of unknown function [Tenacibaculum sp. 190130A14a]|uniref:Uncharacterized protein n=1 Tax=Tenacibaculum polynesiense TaxID=3137857 RepID=A0ABP1EW69_9FLAO
MVSAWNNEILANPIDKEPKEVFMAYCNEIGDYFEERGFKYFKSKPRIEKRIGDIIISVNFWSFTMNRMNDSVLMEILPYAKSKKLKKWIKTNGVGRNEFLFGPIIKSNVVSILGHSPKDFETLMERIHEVFIKQLENFVLIIENPKNIIELEENHKGLILDNFLAYICMDYPDLAELAFEKFKLNIDKTKEQEFLKWREANKADFI